MLRRGLIAASESERLRRFAEGNPATRAVAMRFVAGETLDDALGVAESLHGRGMSVTLDYLGESVDDASVARDARDVYLAAIDRLTTVGVDASVSVKPSQLGIAISRELCRGLIADVAARASEDGVHVTIDMEGSDLTEATIQLVLDLHAGGHDNVGCAVQAYLLRTPEDVAKLTAIGASLRLCKGAYAEPAEIAHQGRTDVDRAYARLAAVLLDSGTYPRIATHDHRLIQVVRNLARRRSLTPQDFEFQMLYGVREPLQKQLVDDGYRLRIYVPFGREWYPYYVRRLAERPANVALFLRALAGSLTGR